MGYIFIPKEFKEGKIPTLTAYQKAMKMLRGGLEFLVKEGLIYGANIHGSNFHIDGGVGSDIDVLVVVNGVDTEKYLSGLGKNVRKSTYVPIEFVPTLRGLAERGHHQLDSSYVLYMKNFCKNGIIGRTPFDVISPKPTWSEPKQEVIERFQAQLSKLSKQRSNLTTDYNKEYCDFLEKVIRQPIYAAIDMLRLRHGTFPSRNGTPLSKAECCELYAQEFPELATEELFTVLDVRTRYRKFLEERQFGDLDEYIYLLDRIYFIYPVAREVINRNFEYLLGSSSIV